MQRLAKAQERRNVVSSRISHLVCHDQSICPAVIELPRAVHVLNDSAVARGVLERNMGSQDVALHA